MLTEAVNVCAGARVNQKVCGAGISVCQRKTYFVILCGVWERNLRKYRTSRAFPGGPVVRTLGFHSRGHS